MKILGSVFVNGGINNMNKQRLCIPKGSWVSGSCRYWYDHEIDEDTRITIQKCDFDRLFFARVNIRQYRMNEHDTQVTSFIWHQDTRGKTAVEALKNAMNLLEKMRETL